MSLSLNLPVNSVSFGQISTLILRELFKCNKDVSLIPIGQPDLSTQPLPIKKANSIPASIKRRVNLAKETYIQDFKVVDYRYYRSRPTSNLDKEVLTGTPANSEISTKTSEESDNIVEIAYVSFLGKSLKYFSQNKFKEALSRFDLIMETYPDDVNALFYSALCNYNLNQFSLCEKRLIELKNSKFTNFDEEQEWYLLLTYYSLHKDQQFLELKSQISANATLNDLRAQAKKEGIEPLRIAGARKVLEGVTTLEEVLRVVPLS
jgi:tetratricopeptide (TPR) repeat protein